MSPSSRISSLALVDQTIDERYIVRRVIAQGPRSTIVAVEDLEAPGRDTVLRLAAEVGSPDVEAIYREAFRVGRAIRHPHIARLYDVGCIPYTDQPYVTAERVRGHSFHDAIDHLDEPTFCEVVAQLCRALRFLHHRGLAHGGVNASNVVVETQNGPTAKLLDVGLASEEGPTPPASEAERAEATHDSAADMKALGAMLLEALLGQAPSADNGRRPVSHFLRTLSARLRPPRLDLSAGVWAVLRRLVSDNSTESTLSPGEVIVELANAAGMDLAVETEATAQAYLDSAPFCGRREVLDSWSERLESLSRGPLDTPLLVLQGEWGSGKTRLLAEMAARAPQDGVRTASRSCCDLAGSDGRRFAEQVDRFWARFREAPSVLFLDDLHHLTTTALHDLRGRLRAARCGGGLVVCSCLGEPWQPPAFREFLHGCEHDETIECVRLEPLSTAEQAEYVATACPATLADSPAESVRERTHGNPLLLSQILADVLDANREALATQPTPVLTRAGEDAGLSSLPELIDGRLARLTEDQLHLLRACVLLAGPVPEGKLGDIVGSPTGGLRSHISLLQERRLLRVCPGGSGLTVSLPVARRVREGMSRQDVKALHRHLARVFGRAEALAVAAEHLSLAGDAPEAASLAGPAAEQLAREGQHGRAVSLAQIALCAGGSSVQDQRRLLELVGDAASELGQREEAVSSFQAALELAGLDADRPAHVRLCGKCSRQLAQCGRSEEALDMLDRARRDLGPDDTPGDEEAQIDCAEAEVWLLGGHASRALEVARRSVQRRTVAEASMRAELFRLAGCSLNRLGRYREAHDQLKATRDLYARVAGTVGAAKATGEMATALRCLGDLSRAEQLCHDAIRQLEGGRSPLELARAHHTLAEVHACRANWDRAKDHCGQAIELKERRDGAADLSWACLGEIEVAIGALASAVRASDLASRSTRASAPDTRAEVQLRVAAIWCELGDLDRALALAPRASEVIDRSDRPIAQSALHRLLGNCCSLRGRHREAATELGQAVAAAEETQDLAWLQAVLTDRCAAHGRAGEVDAALASGERATSVGTELTHPQLLAVAQTQHARALHAAERSREALELLHPAYQTLRRSRLLLKKAEAAAALGEVYLSRGNLIYFCHYTDDCLDAFEIATEDLRDEHLKQTFLRDPRRRQVFDMIEQAKH